jgi:hypothetical protein
MLIVVGGHSRKIGKSSIIVGLIQALPKAHWTAAKITQHGHMLAPGVPFVLTEQTVADSTDSGRYLAAGARKSFWLNAARESMGLAVQALVEVLAASENAIVESNGILEFVRPDLYLVVLDFAVRDFKESSWRFLGRGDVYVLLNEDKPAPVWRAEVHPLLQGKPQFHVVPPDYAPKKLVEFVENRLRPRTGMHWRAGARHAPPVV